MLKNAFLLFAVAFVVLVAFVPTFSRVQDLKQRDLEYQRHINELEREHAKLKKEKRLLEDDPVYLEKVAREKMGLIREGEVVYQIMPANSVISDQ